MKLTKVTFTGVDEKTDLDHLQEIGKKYPYVEFGVLMSYNWPWNGSRFPNPQRICKELRNRGLQLSAHFCGEMAIDIARGETSKTICGYGGDLDIFRRCQLNLQANGMFATLRHVKPFMLCDEVIIQMHTPELFQEFLKGKLPQNASYLLDASGGRGIDTPIEIVTSPNVHIGYAGGIGVDNVEKKLRTLLDYDSPEKFWIDMETRVRTDDEWLDLEKVEKVLEICDPIIKEYRNHEENE